MDQRLDNLQRMLMRAGTWRYLRYIHLREYVSAVAREIETIAVCGAGHGWAELALAIEFPHLRITLTDIIATNYPNYHKAMELAWDSGIDNVAFSIWDVLKSTTRRFDMVCSTEMLEHIERADEAVANMRTAANRYVYCLAPFADAATNANEQKRKQAFERHRHFVCGYDAPTLKAMFGEPVKMAGTYWPDAGGELRNRLSAMLPDDIRQNYKTLAALAHKDIRNEIPVASKDAQGIKVLSRA